MAFLAGWTITDLLDDLTFDQVHFVITCMLKHKSDTANFVMETISGMLGGKVKGKSKNKNRRSKDEGDYSMNKDGDAALKAMQAMGINVKEEKA